MKAATFECPACRENFHYKPSKEVELRVGEDMKAKDPHRAKMGVSILIECPHCPSSLVLDLTKGTARSVTTDGGTVDAATDLGVGAMVWDMTATEAVKERVSRLNDEGNTARAEGKADKARKKFEEAVKLRRHDPVSWYNLGVVKHQSGDLAGAEDAYRRAVEHQELVNALSNLGMLLMQSGRVDEAESSFDRGIAADPGYPKCYLGKGSVYAMRGDKSEARRYYELALSKDPSYEAARQGLSQLAML